MAGWPVSQICCAARKIIVKSTQLAKQFNTAKSVDIMLYLPTGWPYSMTSIKSWKLDLLTYFLSMNTELGPD